MPAIKMAKKKALLLMAGAMGATAQGVKTMRNDQNEQSSGVTTEHISRHAESAAYSSAPPPLSLRSYLADGDSTTSIAASALLKQTSISSTIPTGNYMSPPVSQSNNSASTAASNTSASISQDATQPAATHSQTSAPDANTAMRRLHTAGEDPMAMLTASFRGMKIADGSVAYEGYKLNLASVAEETESDVASEADSQTDDTNIEDQVSITASNTTARPPVSSPPMLTIPHTSHPTPAPSPAAPLAPITPGTAAPAAAASATPKQAQATPKTMTLSWWSSPADTSTEATAYIDSSQPPDQPPTTSAAPRSSFWRTTLSSKFSAAAAYLSTPSKSAILQKLQRLPLYAPPTPGRASGGARNVQSFPIAVDDDMMSVYSFPVRMAGAGQEDVRSLCSFPVCVGGGADDDMMSVYSLPGCVSDWVMAHPITEESVASFPLLDFDSDDEIEEELQ